MLDSADLASVMQLQPGADQARRLSNGFSKVAVWSTVTGDWGGSVQIELATPRSLQEGVWFKPDDLRFTANRIANIQGDFHVRAIVDGATPAGLTIEFLR